MLDFTSEGGFSSPHAPSRTSAPYKSARRAKYPRRPRRVALWGGAASSLRPVNTEHAETRRHGGILNLGYAHLCNVPPDSLLHVLTTEQGTRSGRDALVASVYGRTQMLRASQPQKTSPCPRASARSVLTGRRPIVPHVRKPPLPPRHRPEAIIPSTFSNEISMRNKSNHQINSITLYLTAKQCDFLPQGSQRNAKTL